MAEAGTADGASTSGSGAAKPTVVLVIGEAPLMHLPRLHLLVSCVPGTDSTRMQPHAALPGPRD